MRAAFGVVPAYVFTPAVATPVPLMLCRPQTVPAQRLHVPLSSCITCRLNQDEIKESDFAAFLASSEDEGDDDMDADLPPLPAPGPAAGAMNGKEKDKTAADALRDRYRKLLLSGAKGGVDPRSGKRIMSEEGSDEDEDDEGEEEEEGEAQAGPSGRRGGKDNLEMEVGAFFE
jgi:hypothetical protein